MGEGEGRNLLSSLQPGARDLAQPGLIFLLFALSYGRYSLLCGPPRAPREDPTLLPSSQPIHCAAAVVCRATSGQTDFLYTFNKEDFPYPTLHRGSVNFLTAMGDQESKYETRKKNTTTLMLFPWWVCCNLMKYLGVLECPCSLPAQA